MADLAITATTVLHISGPTATGTLNITGTQGTAVTLVNSVLEKASNTTAALANWDGILLTSGSSGQKAIYATAGAVVEFTSTPALVVGELYVISVTGLLSPVGDYTTADFLGLVGHCGAASKLTLQKLTTGVARA